MHIKVSCILIAGSFEWLVQPTLSTLSPPHTQFQRTTLLIDGTLEHRVSKEKNQPLVYPDKSKSVVWDWQDGAVGKVLSV